MRKATKPSWTAICATHSSSGLGSNKCSREIFFQENVNLPWIEVWGWQAAANQSPSQLLPHIQRSWSHVAAWSHSGKFSFLCFGHCLSIGGCFRHCCRLCLCLAIRKHTDNGWGDNPSAVENSERLQFEDNCQDNQQSRSPKSAAALLLREANQSWSNGWGGSTNHLLW